jgi:AcrR family transcriptional regulator
VRLREATIALVLERRLYAVDTAALWARADYDPAAFERDPADPWRARLRATAYAAALYLRDRPLATRFDMLAVLGIGEMARAHRDRYVRRLVELIDEGRGEMADPTPSGPATAEGVFGAIYGQLARELGGGGTRGGAEEVVPG